MTITDQDRRKIVEQIAADDKRIRAAMAKAIRQVRHQARINNTKLVVANEKSWNLPK